LISTPSSSRSRGATSTFGTRKRCARHAWYPPYASPGSAKTGSDRRRVLLLLGKKARAPEQVQHGLRREVQVLQGWLGRR
jgi:hypothetical protein